MNKSSYVYILASDKNGTLYVGVTSNLVRRIFEHKSKDIEGFTKKYNVVNLVWFEVHENIENAIHREKRLKKYKREAKIKLIEANNRDWNDLYEGICR